MNRINMKREKLRSQLIAQWRGQQYAKKRHFTPGTIPPEINIMINMFTDFKSEIELKQDFYDAYDRLFELDEFTTGDLSMRLPEIADCFKQHPKLSYVILAFLELCCQKEVYFFRQFMQSQLYYQIMGTLNSFDLSYKIAVIQFIVELNKIFKHQVNTMELFDYLKVHIIELRTAEVILEKVLTWVEGLILLLVTCKLDKRQEQVLICYLNNYLILLLKYKKQSAIRNDGLVQYLEFMQKKINLFDKLTLDLIDQIAFNPELRGLYDEQEAAVAIIGQLMTQNHTHSKFYFELLSSEQFSLMDKLLITLKMGSSNLRRTTLFAISNIFADAQFNLREQFCNGAIQKLFESIKSEENVDVQECYLVCCDNLIINAEQDLLIIMVQEYDLIDLIIQFDHESLYLPMCNCILHLLQKTECESQVLYEQMIGIYQRLRIPIFIEKISDHLPYQAYSDELKQLQILLLGN